MKYLKVIAPLIVLAALLVVVLPVAADQPGTNEDPFGGWPIGYAPAVDLGRGGTASVGVVARFGLAPGTPAIPGGVPSAKSGDGTSPRKSIYLGGAWGSKPTPFEPPLEFQNCSTLQIPTGQSRWFKVDTWKFRKLQLWLDDELEGATKPSGSAVWGAANGYMWGTAPGDAWQAKAFDTPSFGLKSAGGPFTEGYVMAIYDPTAMQPNFNFSAPNAALYTTNVSGSSQGVTRSLGNVSVAGITGHGVEGYGQYNPVKPNHLLWYEARFDGWVHARVYNQMIWNGFVSVCALRVD